MKKFILGALAIGFVAVTTMSLTTHSQTISAHKNVENSENQFPNACHYGQCHATAKSTGNRCLHCVSNYGDYYCWQHK
jgi:hypothetical protein